MTLRIFLAIMALLIPLMAYVSHARDTVLQGHTLDASEKGIFYTGLYIGIFVVNEKLPSPFFCIYDDKNLSINHVIALTEAELAKLDIAVPELLNDHSDSDDLFTAQAMIVALRTAFPCQSNLNSD